MRARADKKKSADAARWVAARILPWFEESARDLPWRRTADPYSVWVSEIMLQQTQVKTVIPYFERWMSELPTVEALAGARIERIHKLWEGLGYYTRARNMHRAAQEIVIRHRGAFPRAYDEVLALPGIGRYTAGAVCSIAFNQPTPILDGNVIRVLTRFHGITSNARGKPTTERLWALAESLVKAAGRVQQPRACSSLNQGLMELGATICAPRNPDCARCPLAAKCVARARGWVERLPNLGKRVATTERRFVAALVTRNGAVLVRQRPAGVVNAHMWEFPNVEVSPSATPELIRAAIASELGCEIDRLEPLAAVRHSITRYRVTLDAVVVAGASSPNRKAGEWKTAEELKALPFASAHRRAGAQWKITAPALA